MSDPRSILILSPSLPVPFGETDARNLTALIQALAARGHDVTCVACTDEDPGRVPQAQALAAEGGYRLRYVPLVVEEPLVLRKLRSLRAPFSELARVPALRTALEEELGSRPDVIHVQHVFTARGAPRTPRTVHYVDHVEVVDWAGRKDMTLRERLARWQMGRATKFVLERAERVVAASDRVAEEVRAYGGRPDVEIVPVGVDASRYEPVSPVAEPVAGLIGSMHWYPSRSAAIRLLTRIWPEVHAQMPEARLRVAGWNARRYLGGHLPVAGVGLVDEVARPVDFFSGIALLAYPPPRGSGPKIKVLEAMAFGVPVVSNAEGFEGISFTDGADAVSAETDREFVDRMIELLGDPGSRAEIGRNGRRLVESCHDPAVLAEQLLTAYDRLLGP